MSKDLSARYHKRKTTTKKGLNKKARKRYQDLPKEEQQKATVWSRTTDEKAKAKAR